MAEKASKSENQNPPVWEWIIAAIGLILVAGAVGTMFYRAATEETTPPQLAFIVDSIEPVNSGFLVRFSVKNTGNQTAAGLTVEGVLKKDDREAEETSTANLTYVPANSTRQGGLFFSKNPTESQLQIRALGYEKP